MAVRQRDEWHLGRLSGIGAVLEDLIGRRESRTRVKEKLAALVWREVVGEFYADRTSVTRVHRGIMFVACNSPALAHQLSLDAAEIIRKLNAELAGPIIREIRPATGYRARRDGAPGGGPRRRTGPSRGELEAIALTAEELAAIDRKAGRVADEALRARFRKAAIGALRARKWRAARGHVRCPACGWEIRPGLESCSMCGGART